MQGIYVHIPFCRQKCLYCDFPSYAGIEETIDEYIDALCAEISAGASSSCTPVSVFFGGGTPSLLSAAQMERVVRTLETKGYWQGVQERSLEANPGTVDVEKLRAYRKLGFNRISFGVQSFQADKLKSIGRIHSPEQAVQAVVAAQKAGFDNINIDLMYGLPGQDADDIKSDIDTAASLGVSHISCYGLTVEEGTPLCELVDSGGLALPEQDRLYDIVTEYLPQKGYKRYEISNYAKEGCECTHNKLYWQYRPYIGFGAAACSFNGEKRITNTFDIDVYIKGKENTPKGIETIDTATAMAEFVFMGLRMTAGINAEDFADRFRQDIFSVYGNQIDEHIISGWMTADNGNIKLTDEGMKIGNKIFLTFLPLTY